MNRALLLVGLLILTAVPSHALLQQRSFDFFVNRAERYVDKPITMGCTRVYRMSSRAEHADGVVLFNAETLGDDSYRWALVVVPVAEAEAFARRYNIAGRYDPRPLTGVLKRKESGFYVSFAGALLPDSAGGAEPRPSGEAAAPSSTPVPFDNKPMTSFSYQGQRLIEAAIQSVEASGVTVTAKDGTSVTVPLDEAKKIPDLRMRARAAMDAAAAQAEP